MDVERRKHLPLDDLPVPHSDGRYNSKRIYGEKERMFGRVICDPKQWNTPDEIDEFWDAWFGMMSMGQLSRMFENRTFRAIEVFVDKCLGPYPEDYSLSKMALEYKPGESREIRLGSWNKRESDAAQKLIDRGESLEWIAEFIGRSHSDIKSYWKRYKGGLLGTTDNV